jgi:putative peptide zinc metalloprotease protein
VLCACRHWIARDAVACRVCGRLLQADAVAYDLVLPSGERVRVLGPTTIGRDEENVVALDDDSVSRTHARLYVEEGHPVLEDVGSRYGTTIAGVALTQPREVADGTTFRVGDTYLKVERRRAAFESKRTRRAPLLPRANASMAGLHPEQRPLVFKRLDAEEGPHRYVLKHPDGNRYRRLSDDDGRLVERMDGRTDFSELLAEAQRVYGAAEGPERLRRLMVDLGDFGCMLLDGDAEVKAPRRRRLAAVGARRQVWTTARAGAFFASLYRHGAWVLFSRLGLATTSVIAAVGAAAFVSAVVSGRATPLSVDGRLALGALALLVGRLALVLAHEFAHGLTLTCMGRSVSVAGVQLVLVFPYAYVDTSEVWFEPRKRRIAVSLAGPGSDLVLGGLFAIAAAAGPATTVRDVAFQVALAGYLGAFYNLNPLLERDGYHALSDTFGLPDLRERARAQAAGSAIDRPTDDGDPRRKLTHYAIAAVGWTVAAAALTAALFHSQRERIADALGDWAAVLVTVAACAAVAMPLVITYGPPLVSRLRRPD